MNDPLAAYRAGSSEPWAVSVLQALVRLTRPMNLLELGTFEGRTTRALADVMPMNAYLWTVDCEQRHAGFDTGRIIFERADAIQWLRDAKIPFNFAFVDDDHDAAHVAHEIELLRPLMFPGGLIVMHDVIGPFGLDAVVRDAGGFIVELPLLHAAGGLGIIQT